MSDKIRINLNSHRHVTLCNHNFSHEGILHPDRTMTEYDLLYMQNGTWDIIEDDKTYHLETGSVLLLEPFKHHYSVKKCSPQMRNAFIHFKYDEADSNSETEDCLFVPKLISVADHPEVRHSIERVIDAFWSPDKTLRDLRSSILLENLLLQLSDLGNESIEKSDILIYEIIHRFHSELERFFSPEELSRDYNVSVRTISGRFKKFTGQSIHQYQLQMKLNMIYDVLPILPGRSLHDIALNYGFYDEFQLSKLFKKRFGISPSERR